MPFGQLIDTDVLIDYLRNNELALRYIDSLSTPLFLSSASVGELYAGVREGTERVNLEKFITSFEILPVDRAIAEMGGVFRRDYRNSCGTGLVDAFIAATAKIHDLELVTLNRKHYQMLTNLLVPYEKKIK